MSDANITRFLADPYEYFGFSAAAAMRMPRPAQEQLQLAALQSRFAEFRDAIPLLKRLADNEAITRIDQMEDVLPLLFDHQTYKSYPRFLLDERRFDQLTRWLNKLTTIDLSGVDVSKCTSIDEWMTSLERLSPLSAVHTTGSSGTMSFLPCSKSEWERFVKHHILNCFEGGGRQLPLDVNCIYPYYRSGGWSHAASNNAFVKLIAGSEERFHAAYPGRLSSDLLLLAARRRAAEASGELEKLRVPPELAARREEFEAQQRAMPQHLADFFTKICAQLAGRQIFTQVTASMLIGVAQRGLEAGHKQVFAPTSVIVTGGGGKGMVLPPDWEETVKSFFGVPRLSMTFGMSEMIGVYPRCDFGHYHAAPWNIPFILDIDSSKPLPRHGRTSGRFAFYDLQAETRWGGFITGDAVTMDWDAACPCGSPTPYIVGEIKRVSEVKGKDAGEEKITCASTPEAYEDALDFLNIVEV